MHRTWLAAALLVTVPLTGCLGLGGDVEGLQVEWTDRVEQATTGEPVRFQWQVIGEEGTIDHTSVHYGTTPVEDPGDGRAYSEDAGAEDDAAVPGHFEAEVSFERAGTYYVRAHAEAGGDHVWTPELEVEVEDAGPLDNATDEAVVVTNHTANGTTGQPLHVNWTVAGFPGDVDETGFAWALAPVDDPGTPADYGNTSGTQEHALVPGHFNASFVAEEAGTYHGRAYAMRDGTHAWSHEVSFNVTGAGNHTGNGTGGNQTGNQTGPQNLTVEITDTAGLLASYDPDELVVRHGDNVTWTNNGSSGIRQAEGKLVIEAPEE